MYLLGLYIEMHVPYSNHPVLSVHPSVCRLAIILFVFTFCTITFEGVIRFSSNLTVILSTKIPHVWLILNTVGQRSRVTGVKRSFSWSIFTFRMTTFEGVIRFSWTLTIILSTMILCLSQIFITVGQMSRFTGPRGHFLGPLLDSV